MTPDWWEFVLLAVAVWRIWHLLAHDSILDRPRRYLLRLSPDWRKEGDPVGEGYRLEWALFLTCPYCAGFWIGLLAYAGWIVFGPGEWDPDELFMAGISVFAISAGVVAAHKLLTQPE